VTGSNVKAIISDSGGTDTEHTIAISSADTWEEQEWDISGVADADKDAINQIQLEAVAMPGSYGETGNLFIDGQTTIEDENGTHTITANGDAAISTAQYCSYGNSSSSIYFDGNGDYLSIPYSSDWDFGSGDFTIDLWVYRDGWGDGTTNAVIYCPSTWYIYLGGTANIFEAAAYGLPTFLIQHTDDVPDTTWCHLAFVRYGNVFTLYLNGTSVGSTTKTGSIDTPGNPVYIGASHAGLNMKGYMDNIRIVKGTALWTSNFTLSDANLFYGKAGTHYIDNMRAI